MADESSQPCRPSDRGHLMTEHRNEQSMDLDECSTLECLKIINDADQQVAPAVRDQIHHIADLTNRVIDGLSCGGRLIYLGAGTSGRLGVLDASECPPTFQTPTDQIIGIIAGGDASLRRSSESKEDHPTGAYEELDGLSIGRHDIVLGIAAGGTTPYVLGGVEYAKSLGASSGLLVCTAMERPAWCDVLIAIETGPEVLTGSTRMKAGSATKMVLNMITTGAMVGLGKVYSNLMVDLRASNEKLKDRAARIVSELGGVDRNEAFLLLERGDQSVKHAIVMAKLNISFDEASRLLDEADGRLRRVLDVDSSRGRA